MRKYETILILDPDLEEEQGNATLEKIKGIISQTDGEIIKVEDWGKRKLAYEVKKKSRGHYILIHFIGSPTLLVELERNCRVMDAVLKFQTIRLDGRQASSLESSIQDEPLKEEFEEIEET